MNAAAGNLRLMPGSPLINSGTNAPIGGLAATDVDGNLRVAGITVDVGAFGHGATPPSTTTTTAVPTTTTTAGGCAAIASEAAVICPLDAPLISIQGGVPGALSEKLDTLLATGKASTQRAETSTGRARKRALRRATKAIDLKKGGGRSRPTRPANVASKSSILRRSDSWARREIRDHRGSWGSRACPARPVRLE